MPYYPPASAGTAPDDTAYNATSWDGVTTIAPTKNAVRDKVVTMDAATATAQSTADGKQASDADLTSWAAIARASGFDTLVATPTLANLSSLISDANIARTDAAQSFVGLQTFDNGVASSATITATVASGGYAFFTNITGTASTLAMGLFQSSLADDEAVYFAQGLGWPGSGAGYTKFVKKAAAANNRLSFGFSSVWADVLNIFQSGGVSVGNTTDPGAGIVSVTGNISVTDDPYAAGWNGSTNVPTKNAVYDKIESLVGGATPDIALSKTAPTTSQVITAGKSAYVVGPYEIVAGTSLEIEAGACFEIG